MLRHPEPVDEHERVLSTDAAQVDLARATFRAEARGLLGCGQRVVVERPDEVVERVDPTAFEELAIEDLDGYRPLAIGALEVITGDDDLFERIVLRRLRHGVDTKSRETGDDRRPEYE